MKKIKIKYNGYEVVFKNGKAYLKHVASCEIKKFGVRVESLYKLEEDACITLRRKAWIRDVLVEREHNLVLKRKHQLIDSWFFLRGSSPRFIFSCAKQIPTLLALLASTGELDTYAHHRLLLDQYFLRST